jgi:hypothetical protein
MEIPVCANFKEGTCSKSNTFVEREGDQFFTIKCKTCGGLNVWPKDKDENHARYQAFLKKQLMRHQQEEAMKRKRAYSFT